MENTQNKVLSNSLFFENVISCIKEGKEVVIRAKGRSMRPFIKNLDFITLVPITSEVKVGDIVLARYGDNYIVHRVKAIYPDRIYLFGDGNLRFGENCTPDNIIALVTKVERAEGGEVIDLRTEDSLRKARRWNSWRPLRYFVYGVGRLFKKILHIGRKK